MPKAKNTMLAIMSRMSAYTGQSLTWQQAINSQQDLSPSGTAWDAEPPEDSVAVPGVTLKLVDQDRFRLPGLVGHFVCG
jgi:hypothetical protein